MRHCFCKRNRKPALAPSGITADVLRMDLADIKARIGKKKQASVFLKNYPCTVQYVPSSEKIEIRLPSLTAEEFHAVFHEVCSILGEPVWFKFLYGFIWKLDGHSIALGRVEIGCHYDIPMLLLQKEDFDDPKIDYPAYREVCEVFIKTGFFSEESFYMEWCEEFGFMVICERFGKLYSFRLHNRVLSAVCKERIGTSGMPATEQEIFRQEYPISSLQELEKVLTELLIPSA
ncbi:MAG: hypothetical protein IKC63_07865 [Clostridia bacterium]|nr:hypothetical protein [Clostridia bacterium]